MAKFTDYTEKTEPVDTDLALIYDTPAKVNKKFTFGNLWKWIAKKIVSEGISQLDTTNKTIPGAINELNSKTMHSKIVKVKNVSIPTIGYAETMINKPQNTVFVGINNFGKINPASSINIALSDYDGTVYIFGLPGTNIDWIEIICLFCN